MVTWSVMAVRAMVRLIGAEIRPGFSSQVHSGTSSPAASASRMKPRWQRIWAVTRVMTDSSSSFSPAAPRSLAAMVARRWTRDSTSAGGCSTLCLASMASMLAWGTRMLPEASKARSSMKVSLASVVTRPVARVTGGTVAVASSSHRTDTSPSRTVSPGFRTMGSVTGTSFRVVPFRECWSSTQAWPSLRKNRACTRLTALELIRMSAASPRPMVVPSSVSFTECLAPSTSRFIFMGHVQRRAILPWGSGGGCRPPVRNPFWK